MWLKKERQTKFARPSSNRKQKIKVKHKLNWMLKLTVFDFFLNSLNYRFEYVKFCDENEGDIQRKLWPARKWRTDFWNNNQILLRDNHKSSFLNHCHESLSMWKVVAGHVRWKWDMGLSSGAGLCTQLWAGQARLAGESLQTGTLRYFRQVVPVRGKKGFTELNKCVV